MFGPVEWPIRTVVLDLSVDTNYFNTCENSKDGQEMLESMIEDARIIRLSKPKLTQKMHPVKMFVFPRVDYQMMCADMYKSHLTAWDSRILGIAGDLKKAMEGYDRVLHGCSQSPEERSPYREQGQSSTFGHFTM
jgi:hypothetical protein